MQEHEHIYGHEHEWNLDNASSAMNFEDSSSQEQARSEIDELMNEVRTRRTMLWLGKGLVVGFVLCLLASVAAFWFSGVLLSPPDQLLPIIFLKTLATNRLLVLCVPVICLGACYIALRSLTAEIMGMPERYLDERQKMIRDQAHRSAFKIIKFASVLIPVAFVLPHLPWFNTPAPAITAPPAILGKVVVFHAQGDQATTFILTGPGQVYWSHVGLVGVAARLPSAQSAQQPNASTPEIALAGGLLLLALILVVSALPMAVLAWKGKA